MEDIEDLAITTFTYLCVIACTSPDVEDIEVYLNPSVSKSIIDAIFL